MKPDNESLNAIRALEAYINFVRQRRALEAYAQISTRDQSGTSVDQFTRDIARQEAIFGELASFSIESAPVLEADRRRATIKVVLQFKEASEPIEQEYTLIRETEWRISLRSDEVLEKTVAASERQMQRPLQATVDIAGHKIGYDQDCFIIGEAGVNHKGNLELAEEMVEIAAAAGVDAVKFQTYSAELVAGPGSPKPNYQLRTTDPKKSQQEMLRELQLSADEFSHLQGICKKNNVLFLSTPFDEGSVDLLQELDVPAFKISSGDITHIPLLTHVASFNKPIILSTGMSNLFEVDQAVQTIQKAGCDKVVVLHCVSEYPADSKDVNLRAMDTMAKAFNAPIGFSDHTEGIQVPLLAAAMGACVIEKHFTLSREFEGPDQQTSLEPDELRTMVDKIREIKIKINEGETVHDLFPSLEFEELASLLGSGIKEPADSEQANRLSSRRSLALLMNVEKGTALTKEMLTSLRPAGGISPAFLDTVVGLRMKNSLKLGDVVRWDDLA